MRAFETWYQLVEFKEPIQSFDAFMKRTLAVGWRTWADRNFRLVRRRDAMRRALKAKDRILRRMILKSCSKAWRTWQPHVVWDRAVAADRVLGLRCLPVWKCLSRRGPKRGHLLDGGDAVHASEPARPRHPCFRSTQNVMHRRDGAGGRATLQELAHVGGEGAARRIWCDGAARMETAPSATGLTSESKRPLLYV